LPMTPRERQRKDESSDSFAPEISGETEQATSLKEASTPPNRTYDDAKLEEVVNLLDSSNEPQRAAPLVADSELMNGMAPIVKVEDNGPRDNPVTAAMPVTLSAVPPAEASTTVSPPSQPQVLSESMIGQPETGTPAMRATEAQPTSKQGTAEMELSLQYMNDLMEKMKSRNLSAVFEILNKLADPKLQPYRARSLEKVTEKMTLPNETMLQYVNNDMNLIRQDLKSNNDFARGLPKIKRERVEALVEEWFKLDLTKAKPAELPRWAETEVREILNNRDLAPPTRADQPAATLNVQWPPRN
jgi:hypothetical protein